jgi:hypothetical protein
MYHQICLSEQRCQVLSIAERGADHTPSEGLRGADNPLDHIGVMDGHAGACGSDKSCGRLAGTPATEDEDVTPAQAPRRNS